MTTDGSIANPPDDGSSSFEAGSERRHQFAGLSVLTDGGEPIDSGPPDVFTISPNEAGALDASGRRRRERLPARTRRAFSAWMASRALPLDGLLALSLGTQHEQQLQRQQ
jgi:hypothetical protein